MLRSTPCNTSIPQGSTWYIGMAWCILMRRYAASFGPVAQDALRNCNERANHWILMRLPCAGGQPPGMPPQLGGRSSLPIGAADMKASHLLRRFGAHASRCPTLCDRNGLYKTFLSPSEQIGVMAQDRSGFRISRRHLGIPNRKRCRGHNGFAIATEEIAHVQDQGFAQACVTSVPRWLPLLCWSPTD